MSAPTTVNSQDAGSLFTVTSLVTLQGSALAATIVPNVLLFLIPNLSQTFSNWLTFLIAMVVSILAALQASRSLLAETSRGLFWLAAVLNGFLVFAAAVGIELGAGQVVTPPGGTTP